MFLRSVCFPPAVYAWASSAYLNHGRDCEERERKRDRERDMYTPERSVLRRLRWYETRLAQVNRFRVPSVYHLATEGHRTKNVKKL